MADTIFIDQTTVIVAEWLNQVNRTVFSGPLNVRAIPYSADKTGATASASAINAAIATASAAGGGTVYVPAGNYLCDTAIVMQSNVTLCGDGVGSRLFCGTTLPNGGTGLGQRLIACENITNFAIRNIQVDDSALSVFLAGRRAINCSNSSNYWIEDCFGNVNNSFVASVNCAKGRILNNEINLQSNGSLGGGVIDNWAGTNNMRISGNRIKGNALGQFGILITGVATDGATATPCFKFNISDNRIENCTQVGIWVQGRAGLCYDMTLSNNIIDTITQFYGMELTDCYDITVTGNIVKNTQVCSLRVANEIPGVWVNPNYAGRQLIINSNIFENSNQSVSGNNDTGSAVSLTDTSQAISFSNNVIRGTQHRYAVFLGTNSTGIDVKGEQMQAGTVGFILNQATAASTNTIPGGNFYTPPLTAVTNVAASTAYSTTNYVKEGLKVTQSGRVDVTPTANASTTTLGIGLAIASNFTNVYDLVGVATSQFGNICGAINADTVNKRAQLQFTSSNTSSNAFYYSFSYIIR